MTPAQLEELRTRLDACLDEAENIGTDCQLAATSEDLYEGLLIVRQTLVRRLDELAEGGK